MIRPWHGEARRLRADGISFTEISSRLGVARTTVRELLSDCEKARDRKKKYSRENYLFVRSRPDAKAEKAKKPPLSREAILSAAMAFARNEIDRAELMRRITPP